MDRASGERSRATRASSRSPRSHCGAAVRFGTPSRAPSPRAASPHSVAPNLRRAPAAAATASISAPARPRTTPHTRLTHLTDRKRWGSLAPTAYLPRATHARTAAPSHRAGVGAPAGLVPVHEPRIGATANHPRTHGRPRTCQAPRGRHIIVPPPSLRIARAAALLHHRRAPRPPRRPHAASDDAAAACVRVPPRTRRPPAGPRRSGSHGGARRPPSRAVLGRGRRRLPHR